MTVVYVDRVWILNMLVDYLLLLSTARLAGQPLRRKRFALCAALGACYAVAVFYVPILAHPLGKLLSGALLAWLAYRKEVRPFRMMALFFLLSGGLAGLLLGLGLASGSPTAYLRQITTAQISWPMLLVTTALFTLLLQLLFRQGARHGGGEIMDIVVSIGHHTGRICALHDTGNTLREPINGNPVLVVEQQALRELFPQEIWEILHRNGTPEEKMAQLYAAGSDYRFMLLPFRSVGVSSGLLLAVRSDYILVRRRRYDKALIALSEAAVSDGGGYQALWGAEERRTHEAAGMGKAAAQMDQEQAG